MIEELNVLLRKQTPTPPNEWLYEEYTEEGVVKRNFRPFVYLGKNAEPWLQCTDADKVAYEQEWAREHPQPETIEPEEETTNKEE